MGTTGDIDMLWHIFVIAKIEYICEKLDNNFPNLFMQNLVIHKTRGWCIMNFGGKVYTLESSV